MDDDNNIRQPVDPVNNDCTIDMPGKSFGGEEQNSPILNTPSLSGKFNRTARRNARSRLQSFDARSGINHVQSVDRIELVFPSPEPFSSVIPSVENAANTIMDRTCSDSDEDLFETAPCTTISVAEEIVPSGLGNLLNGLQPADVSWSSSMATPLSGNVTFSNLNTEERKTLLPSDDCKTIVKPRALFTPDPNETVSCQSLNISSDYEWYHSAKTAKTQHQKASYVSKIYPKTSNGAQTEKDSWHHEESLCEHLVCDKNVHEPGHKYLDSVYSPVQKSSLKYKKASLDETEGGLSEKRVQSPVLSGSSHLGDVKKLFGEDQEDPFLDYQDMSYSHSSKELCNGESTPCSSIKISSASDSRSITSTPNEFLKVTPGSFSSGACKVEVKKVINSPPIVQNCHDKHVLFKGKRLTFTSDFDEENYEKPGKDVPQLKKFHHTQECASDILNEFTIPDDSLMEHLAFINATSAASPEAKVLAIKNSYNVRHFQYSAKEEPTIEDLSVRRLQSPLNKMLSFANALEDVPNLHSPCNSLKPTKELVAFNKLHEPSVEERGGSSHQDEIPLNVVNELNCSFSYGAGDAVSSPNQTSNTELNLKSLDKTSNSQRVFDKSTSKTLEKNVIVKNGSKDRVEDRLEENGCKKHTMEEMSNLPQKEIAKYPLSVFERPTCGSLDNYAIENEVCQQPLSKHTLRHVENGALKCDLHSLNVLISSSSAGDGQRQLSSGFKTAGGSELCVPEHSLEKALPHFDGFADLHVPVESQVSGLEEKKLEEHNLHDNEELSLGRMSFHSDIHSEFCSKSSEIINPQISAGEDCSHVFQPIVNIVEPKSFFPTKRKILNLRGCSLDNGSSKRKKTSNLQDSTFSSSKVDFSQTTAFIKKSPTIGEIKASISNEDLENTKKALTDPISAVKPIPDEPKHSEIPCTDKVVEKHYYEVLRRGMESVRNDEISKDCAVNVERVVGSAAACQPAADSAFKHPSAVRLSRVIKNSPLKKTDPPKKTVALNFQASSSVLGKVSGGDCGGFSTASGKSVSVSQAAMRKARRLFESLDEHEPVSVTDVEGFSTASGRSVSVSNAVALNLQESSSVPEKVSGGNSGGFSIASGKSVSVSQAAMRKARRLFESVDEHEHVGVRDMEGFSTAGGRSVSVSNAALKKAQKIFEGLDEHEPKFVSDTKEFSTCNETADSQNAETTTKYKKDTEDVKGSPAVTDKPSSDAVNRKSLEAFGLNVVKNISSVAGGVHDSLPENEIYQDKKAIKGVDENQTNADSGTKGFSTASGKFVSVSQAAMRKAMSIFDDLRDQEPTTFVDMKGFATASGKSVSVSNIALQKAEKVFEGLDEPDISSTLLNGFTTASGKSVNVSEIALQRAQKLFEGVDEHNSTAGASSFPLASAESGSLYSSKQNPRIDVEATTKCYGKDIVSIDRSFLNVAEEMFSNISKHEDETSLSFPKKQISSLTDSPLSSDLKLKSMSPHNIKPQSEAYDDRKVKCSTLPIVKQSNFDSAETLDNVSALFVDDGFFNDSQSMNAISTVMASISTSPSMISDRNSSLQPVLSENQDSGKSCEPTSPILAKNGPRRRPRKGRLSLTNFSSRSSSLARFSPSKTETNNSFSHLQGPSNLIPDALDRKLLISNVDILTSDQAIQHPQNGSLSVPSNAILISQGLQPQSRKSIGFYQLETQEAGENALSPALDTTSNYNNKENCSAPCNKETISSAERSLSHDVETSNKTFSEAYISASKRKSVSCISNSDTCEVKRRRTTSNIYSFSAWPSQGFLSGDERLLRPEVAEMRKRAAEEQKELVDERCRNRGEGLQPCAGSLLTSKQAMKENRTSWTKMVEGSSPVCLSYEKLKCYGVRENVSRVAARNAAMFRFSAWNFYSADMCRENVSGIPVGDGALLVLDSFGEAGIAEIERAFLASPGVDPTLIPSGWVQNHYRWIVWKLAAMERSFPEKFGGRCLTPHILMQQLKYRYDREIDRCERSALRRILEHDDSAAKRMVLCVADIIKGRNYEGRTDVELELTDGWYSILTSIDPELQSRVSQNALKVGTKLITHSAELLNCSEGCFPLEAPSDARLRLCTNSTRRTRWFTKLGFQTNPGPIKISLASIFGSGGVVSSVSTYIARVYPVVYWEKKGEKTVVRSERAESREAAISERLRQDFAEQIYSQIQAEVCKELDKEKQLKNPPRPHHNMASLTSGEELFQLLESSSDPVSVQCMMTEEQKILVANYRRSREELTRFEVESRLKKRLNENLSCERQVTPLLKVRLMDFKRDGRSVTAILSVWRPSDEVKLIFKEGHEITIMGSAANGFRCGELQLSSNRSTRYKEHGASKLLESALRVVSPLKDLMIPNFSPTFGELDIVGVVIRVGPPPKSAENSTYFQSAYVADCYYNFVGILFWGGIKDFAYDDIVVCNSFIAASNLQWRGSPSVQSFPSAYANELSSFTTKPRLPHLQFALQELRQSVSSDLATFIKICDEKLDMYLSSQRRMSAGAFSRTPSTYATLHDNTPGKSGSTPAAESASSTPIKTHRKFTVDNHTSTPSKEISPSVEKRVAKLEMYGEAPPISPIVLGEPNRMLRRSFQAPRRTDGLPTGKSPTVSHK